MDTCRSLRLLRAQLLGAPLEELLLARRTVFRFHANLAAISRGLWPAAAAVARRAALAALQPLPRPMRRRVKDARTPASVLGVPTLVLEPHACSYLWMLLLLLTETQGRNNSEGRERKGGRTPGAGKVNVCTFS